MLTHFYCLHSFHLSVPAISCSCGIVLFLSSSSCWDHCLCLVVSIVGVAIVVSFAVVLVSGFAPGCLVVIVVIVPVGIASKLRSPLLCAGLLLFVLPPSFSPVYFGPLSRLVSIIDMSNKSFFTLSLSELNWFPYHVLVAQINNHFRICYWQSLIDFEYLPFWDCARSG